MEITPFTHKEFIGMVAKALEGQIQDDQARAQAANEELRKSEQDQQT